MSNIPRFMLIEDNPGDILLVQQAFIKINIRNPLQLISSGEQAIQYFSGEGAFADRRQFPLPSVVLLNLNLTGRFGLDVLEWIRCCPALRNLSIIVLASSDSIYDIDRAYKLGAHSFLIKPVRFERLLESITAIPGRWMWHGTASQALHPATEDSGINTRQRTWPFRPHPNKTNSPCSQRN